MLSLSSTVSYLMNIFIKSTFRVCLLYTKQYSGISHAQRWECTHPVKELLTLLFYFHIIVVCSCLLSLLVISYNSQIVTINYYVALNHPVLPRRVVECLLLMVRKEIALHVHTTGIQISIGPQTENFVSYRWYECLRCRIAHCAAFPNKWINYQKNQICWYVAHAMCHRANPTFVDILNKCDWYLASIVSVQFCNTGLVFFMYFKICTCTAN